MFVGWLGIGSKLGQGLWFILNQAKLIFCEIEKSEKTLAEVKRVCERWGKEVVRCKVRRGLERL